jgi:ribosome biogenesis protein Nip4
VKKFIAQFTKQNVVDDAKVKQIGHDYFLLQPEIAAALKSIRLPPLHAGLYLGSFREKTSKPSNDLLQMLAKTEAKKVWLNEKGAWLFVCRRPALAKSITKAEAQPNDLVLVMNEHDECIGYGLYDGPSVKNYYDVGDFLRRERTPKRA